MRKSTIVRLGVAAALGTMGVAGLIGSGCSNSTAVSTDAGTLNDGSSPTPDTGTSSPDSSPGTDGGGLKDTGTPTDGPVSTPFANIVVAHAAPGVPPFRICIGLAQSGGALAVNAGIYPLPNTASGVTYGYPGGGTAFPPVAPGTPGIYPGTIGALPQAVDFTQDVLTPFIVLSSSVATYLNNGTANVNTADGGKEPDCNTLVGKDGQGGLLTLNKDYFQLPSIPAQTLTDGNAFLLTVNGCLSADAVAVPEAIAELNTCGPSYDGGNTANIGVAPLDTTTAVGDGGLGIQFAQRSIALQDFPFPTLPDGGGFEPLAAGGVQAAFFQPQLVLTPGDAGADGGDAGLVPTFPLLPTFIDDGGLITYSPTGLTAAETVPVGPYALLADGGGLDPTVTAVGALVPNDPQAIALPLSNIFDLSQWPASTAVSPPGFQLGLTYTFVLMGDPAAVQLTSTPTFNQGAPDGGYDGRGLHIVAFPNVYTAQQL